MKLSNIKYRLANAGLPIATAAQSSPGPPTAAPAPAPGQSPMNDIHDIKPILDMGVDWHWLVWGLIILAVLAVGLLAWWFWRRRRVRRDGPAVAPLPAPEAEAYALLDQLAAEQALDGKLYYFRLSAILRHYVERRYAFPAAEMTVEELLPRVARLQLPQALFEPFEALCRRAEPIKFAGAGADAHQMHYDLNFVRQFVHQTTPVDIAPSDSPDHNNDQPWAHRIPAEQPSNQITEQQSNQVTEQPNNRITE